MKARIFTRRPEGLRLPAIAAALLLPALTAAQQASTGAQPAPRRVEGQPGAALQVLPVRGNVFMVIGAGSNITVSAGIDGQVLVDAGSAAMADKVIETVERYRRGIPLPLVPAPQAVPNRTEPNLERRT